MRKLLILIVVLGMASWAIAVPIMTVSNPTPVPGETIQVFIDGTAAEASGPLGVPGGGYSGMLAIDFYAYGYLGGSPYLTIMPPPAITPEAGGYAYAGPMYALEFWSAAPLLPWSEPFDVDPGLWFTYNVLVTGAAGQSEVIDLLNGMMLPIGGQMINIIPEPMTMALLGLGGLFLRRRK